jgi:hypothetical protein
VQVEKELVDGRMYNFFIHGKSLSAIFVIVARFVWNLSLELDNNSKEDVIG